jgi:hypothetical protein
MATPMVTKIMLAMVPVLNLSVPKKQPTEKTATGIRALSIWMKETER